MKVYKLFKMAGDDSHYISRTERKDTDVTSGMGFASRDVFKLVEQIVPDDKGMPRASLAIVRMDTITGIGDKILFNANQVIYESELPPDHKAIKSIESYDQKVSAEKAGIQLVK